MRPGWREGELAGKRDATAGCVFSSCSSSASFSLAQTHAHKTMQFSDAVAYSKVLDSQNQTITGNTLSGRNRVCEKTSGQFIQLNENELRRRMKKSENEITNSPHPAVISMVSRVWI